MIFTVGDWVRRVRGNDPAGEILAVLNPSGGSNPGCYRYRVRWGREHPNAIRTIETGERIKRISRRADTTEESGP